MPKVFSICVGDENPAASTFILRKAELTEDQWNKYRSQDFNVAVKEAYFGASSRPKGGRADSAVSHGKQRKSWITSFKIDVEVGESGETVHRCVLWL